MKVLTYFEFDNLKIYALDNIIYNAIEEEFIKFLGERIAKKFMLEHLEITVRELSCNSFVDITKCFRII